MFCENFQLMGGGWVGSTKRCKSKWRKERKNSSECRWKFKTLWIFYRLLRKNWVIFEPPTSHLRTHALFILKRENIGLFCIKRDISNSISCSSSKQRKREIVPSHKPDGNISHVHTHTHKSQHVYTLLFLCKIRLKWNAFIHLNQRRMIEFWHQCPQSDHYHFIAAWRKLIIERLDGVNMFYMFKRNNIVYCG